MYFNAYPDSAPETTVCNTALVRACAGEGAAHPERDQTVVVAEVVGESDDLGQTPVEA